MELAAGTGTVATVNYHPRSGVNYSTQHTTSMLVTAQLLEWVNINFIIIIIIIIIMCGLYLHRLRHVPVSPTETGRCRSKHKPQ